MTRDEAPRYCDRNICFRNEYNGIGCNECEVTKSQEQEPVFYPQVEGITPTVVKQEPREDTISKQAVLSMQYRIDDSATLSTRDVVNVDDIEDLPPVTPKQTIEREFAKWVAEEIFDDNWEYNYGAFAELACRKLEKMGIVKADGDKWHLVESEEQA